MENYLNLYNKIKGELASLEEKKASYEKELEMSNIKLAALKIGVTVFRDDIIAYKAKQDDFILSKVNKFFNKFGYNTFYACCFWVFIVTITSSLLDLSISGFFILNFIASSFTIFTALAMYPDLKKRAIEKAKKSDEYLEILKEIENIKEKEKAYFDDLNNLYEKHSKLESSISDIKRQIYDKQQELECFIQTVLGNAPENNIICVPNKDETEKENDKPLTRIRKKEIDTTN